MKRSELLKKDTDGALLELARFPEQIVRAFKTSLPKLSRPENIALFGMGGSALPGAFVHNLFEDVLPVPFVIHRGYEPPGFIGDKTLVLACSYSGNTEETLSAYEQAKKHRAALVAISSGGELKERAQRDGVPHLLLPSGWQPRWAWGSTAVPLARLLTRLFGLRFEFDEAPLIALLEETVHDQDEACELAPHFQGKIPVFYADQALSFAALKWKIGCNENSKQAAFFNIFSEMNHNEMTGWRHPQSSPLLPVFLRSSLESPRIAERIEITKEILGRSAAERIELQGKGSSKAEQLFWFALHADLVTTYLGLLNGEDPARVDDVESLKKRLKG